MTLRLSVFAGRIAQWQVLRHAVDHSFVAGTTGFDEAQGCEFINLQLQTGWENQCACYVTSTQVRMPPNA